MRYYTGVGSRETPPEILQLIREVARVLADEFRVRTGGAPGADTAFLLGARDHSVQALYVSENYLPWEGFEGYWAAYQPGCYLPQAPSDENKVTLTADQAVTHLVERTGIADSTSATAIIDILVNQGVSTPHRIYYLTEYPKWLLISSRRFVALIAPPRERRGCGSYWTKNYHSVVYLM